MYVASTGEKKKRGCIARGKGLVLLLGMAGVARVLENESKQDLKEIKGACVGLELGYSVEP